MASDHPTAAKEESYPPAPPPGFPPTPPPSFFFSDKTPPPQFDASPQTIPAQQQQPEQVYASDGETCFLLLAALSLGWIFGQCLAYCTWPPLI